MKKNILVFPCGSEIGLEVFRSLAYSTHVNLFGGSSVDDHGKFVYKNYIDGLPYVNDSAFETKINEVIKKFGIDFIIPTHDEAVLLLAQLKEAGTLACDIVTSPLEVCEIARSKRKTYDRLKDIVATPKVFKDSTAVLPSDLPVFLKPEVGQGSKGTALAKTIQDIDYYIQQNPELMIVEYLPGKEYTIDCFTDKQGVLRFCEGRERQRTANGISVTSTTVNNERFLEIASKINDELKFEGAWFFQVKENIYADLVLMEIAPRIAGTMGLVRCKGVNLVLLSLFNRMGYDVDIFENEYDLTIDRALENKYQHNISYQHAYIDFDDLVIFNGRINPIIIAFIYQCLNKGVRVYLITRHKLDLDVSLQKYRLGNIFDEIIWLQNKEDEKYEHVLHKDAIFIDDSFAERKKIHDKLGIPTFDAHMVEALMEKF